MYSTEILLNTAMIREVNSTDIRDLQIGPRVRLFNLTLSQHIPIPAHELLSLPKTNMKSKGSGNATGLKFENRTRTQSRTRSPI